MADDKDVVNPQQNVVDAEKIREEVMAQAEEKIEEAKTDFNVQLEMAEERATTKARESIVEAISGKKEDKWVPKSYEEITEKAKADTLAEVDKKLAEREARVVEKAKREAEEATEQNKKWDQYWDESLDRIAEVDDAYKISEDTAKILKEKGVRKLTATEAKELMENDEGFKNRVELEQEAAANKKSDLELYYYKNVRGKMSGKNAPVFTGAKASVASNKDDFDYDDIRADRGKKPSDFILEYQE